jgi:hypothetical protein
MDRLGSGRDRTLSVAQNDESFRAVFCRLECSHCFLPNAVLDQRIDIWPDNWAASPRIAGARFSLSPNSSEGDRREIADLILRAHRLRKDMQS